jgi:hypothetical protein
MQVAPNSGFPVGVNVEVHGHQTFYRATLLELGITQKGAMAIVLKVDGSIESVPLAGSGAHWSCGAYWLKLC